MNRRSIFSGIAALFAAGVARGQGVTRKKIGEYVDPVTGNTVVKEQVSVAAIPDQCPVCGTLAEPYVRKTEADTYPAGTCMTPPGGNVTITVCAGPSPTELTGPMERITRCRRCSAAFWQDAKE